MPNDAETHLPLDGLVKRQPWALPEQEPSTFIALWPDQHPPMVTEVTAALASALVEEMNVLGEIEPGKQDREVQWIVIVELPGIPHPVMLWSEPAKPVPPDESVPEAAANCRWVVGAETVLGTDDPFLCHTFLMKCLAASLPDAPAILDANTALWHGRDELEAVFLNDEIEPPVDGLWIIHAVEPDASQRPQDDAVWLHTHGLWRCGLPELEMLEVPHEAASDAATMLNEIASLMFESPLPPPGELFEIGFNLNVTLQPWEVVVETMDPDQPGGTKNREGELDHAHTGVRAVVCDPQPRGMFRRVWTWPKRAIQAIEENNAIFYRTKRATERQAMLARSRWDQFATAFSSAHRALNDEVESPRAIFLVKAGYEFDNPKRETDYEHLWFEVRAFHNGQAEAVLLNQPQNVTRLSRGAMERIPHEIVSDWQVQTPEGIFGPDDVEAMWQTLDALKAEREQGQQT